MHGPPNPDRQRELWRERKARQRDREHGGLKFYKVAVPPAVLAALIAQNLDAGLSGPESERASRDRRKVGKDLSAVLTDWARLYLAKRQA